MHLLLTRAREDAERTRARLVEAGHQVSVSPVIAIGATGATGPPGVVDALVATSGHALATLVASWPSPEARRLLPLLLVGQRTAAIAREHGFLGPSVVAATTTDLAVAIPDLPRAMQRLVYIAGRDRKPDLERALAILSRTLEVVETYCAREVESLEPPVVEAIRAGRIEGALHFSRRSASLFVEFARRDDCEMGRLAHFCLSEDVAVPLREAGCARIVVAGAPDEPALLALPGLASQGSAPIEDPVA